MSPLHHHFELCNWSEKKVVFAFWAATVVFVLLGLAGFYGLG
jgi:phospho-N-acetylmuramoyl-pentapeptide-transferase